MMDVKTTGESLDTLFRQSDLERDEAAGSMLWDALGTLYRRRRFVMALTAVVAVLAVVVSLLLPNWYRASTRLLLPESDGGGGAITAMLDNLAPVASSLLGGSKGDYTRYLSILSSRSVLERVVDRFKLVDVYETGKTKAPRQEAMLLLTENTRFVVDEEYEYLSVEVLDRDPQRAADMANYFVEELNRVNGDLLAQNAGNYRRFMEKSLQETEAGLDSARAKMQRFQERYGLIELGSQSEAFLQGVAATRAEAVKAEIQYEVLLRQYGPNNPQVMAARTAQDATNRKVSEALAGGEQLLPVPRSVMPAVGRQYSELMQETLIQAEILKFVRPLYEQARLDEQREREAVQVLDRAVPPFKKDRPKRAIIVLAATFSAFMLAVLYVLALEWWRREHDVIAFRLRQATAARNGSARIG